MPPKRTKRTLSATNPSPPPVRRSSRQVQPPDRYGRYGATQASSSGMAPERGLSTLSTDTEASSKWPTTAASAKQRLDDYVPQEGRYDDKLVVTLKAFLDHLPEGGRDTVAHDILEAEDDQQLFEVFSNLFTGLLASMRTLSRSSVADSPLQKRNANVEHVASTLSEPQSREEQFRTDVFRRDRQRCVLTNYTHHSHWVEMGSPEDDYWAYLEGAHIIPFAMGSENTIHSEDDKAKMWECLFRCFPTVRRTGITVATINNPSNGITLADFAHKEFGKFHIALKNTDVPNKYDLKVYNSCAHPYRRLLPSGPIQFERAEDATDVPFPHPDLLDCHYRIAEILNASGMGEEIDRKLDDWDNMKRSMPEGCLNEDGSTNVADILRTALWQRVTG